MFKDSLDFIISTTKSIDLSAWVSAIATVILASLTFIYIRITKRILEAQSNPCVIISVIHDEERPTILQLVIKNVGAGLAEDISFEFSRPIPARALGISEKDAKTVETFTSGPLVEGIPALGPSEQRKIDWGQYGGLAKNLGSEPIIVKCRFKKNGKLMPVVQCKLDVKSFKGTVATRRPIAMIAKELEKISKDLQRLVTRFPELKVEITKQKELGPENNEEDKK